MKYLEFVVTNHICLCRMQTHLVKKVPTLSAGYVDPLMISESNFKYPKKWAIDSKELEKGKTIEEKGKIREDKIFTEGLKVAARIAICLRNLQNNEQIWLPYHFG
jgi:hypothetical protein